MIKQTAAAVVVFLVAIVIGVLLTGRSSDEPVVATTIAAASTTTTEPRAVFVADGETIVGPVAIIAAAPYVDGTQLVVGFDVANLAPTGDAADVIEQLGFGSQVVIPPEELNTVYLDNWVLTAGGEQIDGTAANPSARAARFEVGPDFDLASVENIAISSYALLTPVSVELELGIGNESGRVAPGVTARLLAVTEQANTIVQVELLSDRGFNLDNLRVSGTGPGWLSAVREAEGRPRWNLTFDSASAPSPIRMKIEGSVWVTVNGSIDVSVEEPE
jgi:hypothetical protein